MESWPAAGGLVRKTVDAHARGAGGRTMGLFQRCKKLVGA
jgi:hypothetical protein